MKGMLAALSPTLLRLDVTVWGRAGAKSTPAMVFLLEECPNIECVNLYVRSPFNFLLLEGGMCFHRQRTVATASAKALGRTRVHHVQ